MKFLNDTTFYDKFEKTEGLKYYPYIGQNFKSEQKKILILAHNIFCAPEKIKADFEKTKSPTYFADALESFTYGQGFWTKTFRNLIKASLFLKQDYTRDSDTETVRKINDFISKISYTNYINDLIVSEKVLDVSVPTFLIEKSHSINRELISLLEVTHIVCWDKNIFDYLINNSSNVERIAFNQIEKVTFKKGFDYAIIEFNGKKINLLKTFHPSMPAFGQYKVETHKIFKWFYELQ